jgi:predicted acyl esterase
VRRLFALLAAFVAAAAFAGAANAFTKTDGMLTMDDGVTLGTTLYIPSGTPPAAGWPAILMLHGLGGSRQDMNTAAESWYVPKGYAVLTYDARGHGQSGGQVTIDGPREITDVKAVFAYLASQPGIDRNHIGGWGVSYGGGATLLAATQGVPFAAIETYETWTDLTSALIPNDLSKSGLIFGFLNEIRPDAVSQLVATEKTDLLQSTNLPAVHALTTERSSLPLIGALKIPTAMFQGKRDFAFDMSQMTRAYAALTAPKHLYLGNLGHAPSKFIADDFSYFMGQGVRWYDRFLKGVKNGIDTGPPVEVAPTPFKKKAVSYPGLPPTKTVSFTFKGNATIDESGKVVRTISLPKGTKLEQFGAPRVTVTASTPNQYPHLVAVWSAVTPKSTLIISEGGIQQSYSATPSKVSFRLDSDSAPIPAGSKLRITLASASTSQDPSNLLYLQTPLPPGSTLTIGDVRVDLPVLKTPISK